MHLYLNTQSINYDQWYSVSDLNTLSVTWPADPSGKYTIIIYDIDAPGTSSKKYSSPFVHFLVTDIPENNVAAGKVSASFMLPSPLRGSGEHRYVVDLYKQTGPILDPPVETHRRKFKIGDFVSRNKLQTVATNVIVVDPDTMQFYLRNPSWQISFNPHHRLIKKDAPLSEKEVKFCSCVVDVAVKNPEECNINQHNNPNLPITYGCYNPYKVCSSRIGTTSRNCYESYNYDEFSATELHALANLTGVHVDAHTSRESIIGSMMARPKSGGYV